MVVPLANLTWEISVVILYNPINLTWEISVVILYNPINLTWEISVVILYQPYSFDVGNSRRHFALHWTDFKLRGYDDVVKQI